MATTAFYIPIVGNFNAPNFLFQNTAADDIPQDPTPGTGPGRPGTRKCGLVFIIGAGPVGDDADFLLRIPHPDSFTGDDLLTNNNGYLPTGSLIYTLATAQEQIIVLTPSLNVAEQTADFAITFGNPLAQPFGCVLTIDFGFTVTN